MHFEPSAKVKELQKRLQQFMDEHIYPGESTYLEQTHSADTWRTPPIMAPRRLAPRRLAP